MKPIRDFEYADFVASLSGSACCLIHDGDYDRAVVQLDGTAVNADKKEEVSYMRCYTCDVKMTKENTAEAYSFESGMCKACWVKYLAWCKAEGIDPETVDSQNDFDYNQKESK